MIMHPVNLGVDIPIMGAIGGAPGTTAIEDAPLKTRLPRLVIKAEGLS
jgi:hypothetical protein